MLFKILLVRGNSNTYNVSNKTQLYFIAGSNNNHKKPQVQYEMKHEQ